MKLEGNKYPGRGIILGKSPDGKSMVQVYWIMGRSSNSQNRIFEKIADGVQIVPFDPAKVEDPSLIIYDPIKQQGDHHIISNGDQTATIEEYLAEGKSFEDAINTRMFEPDAPNYTPRISGVMNLKTGENKISIIKTIGNQEDYYTHKFFSYNDFKPATGFCISTYENDGNPLISFTGEPIQVEIFNDKKENLDYYWKALNPDYLVSMAVKYISIEDGNVDVLIKNKHI